MLQPLHDYVLLKKEKEENLAENNRFHPDFRTVFHKFIRFVEQNIARLCG